MNISYTYARRTMWQKLSCKSRITHCTICAYVCMSV